MKFRNTIIMALTLAVLGGAVYFLEIRGREEREAAAAAEKKLVLFEADDVTSLTLDAGEETIVARRQEDDSWRIVEPVETVGDRAALDNLVDRIERAEHERVVTESPDDLEPFGLADPAVRATLALAEGEELTLELGAGTPVGFNVYARRAGDQTVYMAPGSLKDALDKSLFDLRDKRILTFEEGDVSRVELVAGDARFDLRRLADDADGWELTAPIQGRADTETVSDALDRLRTDRARDFVAEAPTDDELAGWGLDAPRRTVTLWTAEDASQTLEVGGPSEEPAGYYARRRGDGAVFVVPESTFDEIPDSLDALRNRAPITDLQNDRVRWIAIERAEEPVRIERDGSDWRVTEPRSLDADASTVSTLLTRLAGLRAVGFGDSDPGTADDGLDDPHATVRVHLADPESTAGDDSETAAPAEGRTLVVTIGDPVEAPDPEAEEDAEETTLTARHLVVEGDPTVYLVADEDLERVLPDLFALRAKTIVSFTQSELDRIELTADGTTWRLEKEEDVWSVMAPEPAELTGSPVTDLLWDLNYLRMQGVGAEWSADEPAPDLSRFGLADDAVLLRAWVGEEPVADLRIGDSVDPAVLDEEAPAQVWVRPTGDQLVVRVTARLEEAVRDLLEAVRGAP